MKLVHLEYLYQSLVWIGVFCIVLAGVFMGLSVVRLDLRWAGILFIVLAVLVLLLFILLRYRIKKRRGNTDMCALFTDGCVSCCCSSAKGMNCCDCYSEEAVQGSRSREVVVVRTDSSSRASHRRSQRSANGVVRSVSEDVTQSETRTKLRSLERHINLLFRDYTIVENRMNRLRNSESRDRRYLVNRERVQEKLTMVQDTMHREYRKLCRWFQGNDAVAAADVEHARERIRNVREHMRSLLRRIERIERTNEVGEGHVQHRSVSESRSTGSGDPRRPLTENRHSGISLVIQDVDSPPEVVTLEVPGFGVDRDAASSPDVLSPFPPPYQEQDPLPNITQRYSLHEASSNMNLRRESSFRSQATASQDSSSSSTPSPGMVHRPPRVDSFISAASLAELGGGDGEVLPVLVPSATTGSGALVLHLPRDVVVANSLGLGVPAMNEAPPSYEEASSSQV